MEKNKAFQKASKKQLKQAVMTSIKTGMKIAANHWHIIGKLHYQIKTIGKYVYVIYYYDCYRTHYYNPTTNEDWLE